MNDIFALIHFYFNNEDTASKFLSISSAISKNVSRKQRIKGLIRRWIQIKSTDDLIVLCAFKGQDDIIYEFITQLNTLPTDFYEKLCILNSKETIYNTSIYFAIQGGHLHVVKLLLPFSSTKNNMLISSALYNKHDILFFLLTNGENIPHKMNKAIRLAAANGHIDILKTLIKFGADIHTDNDFVIKICKKYNYTDILTLLAKINAEEENKEEENKEEEE